MKEQKSDGGFGRIYSAIRSKIFQVLLSEKR
jgi:hypothetical protein